MKYYMHDTNSFSDDKITDLYMNFGYEGLGLFYTLLERLAYHEKPIKTSVLKAQLKVGKKLNKCWTFMEEIELISSKDGETFNENILKNTENYQNKKEKNKEKISEWREKQKIKNTVTGNVLIGNLPNEIVSKENIILDNKGSTDDLSVDDTFPPIYILPEILRLDYVAVQKFCFGCSLAKMTGIDPKNYETLREKFSHEQIMAVLGEMANTPKIEKDYKSVYLTCNNWLKRDYGKPENMKLAEDMEAVYRVFVKAKANSEPKIDKYERTALNSLADYLTKNSTLKNSDGAMLSWNYILTNWGNMDAFMQNRIKLVEIEKDIIKILKTQRDAANNGHNGTKVTKEDTGGKKAFD